MARILLRGSLLTAVVLLGSAGTAQAHFHLNDPPNWLVQEDDGTPQKMGPCGVASESQPAAQMTNMVTSFKAGDTITIKLEETVYHPGHYRVALVKDRADLPAEPAVTAGTQACGTAAVMNPAVLPVLADGVLDHTSKFTGEQTIMVTIPADMECEKCTLQILEFMSAHGSPCFYHHCADIKVTKDGAGGMSAGGAGGMSAGGAGGMSAGGAAGMSAGGTAGIVATAGTSGMGGVTGQSGSAGAATAGTPSAGMSATAGTAGSGGNGMTAMGGTGNVALGGAGNATTAGTGTTTAGSGTKPAPAADETDAGGGCSTAPGRAASPFALLALLGLAGLRARRRR